MAICVGIAMVWLAGCATMTHGTETATTSESSTTNPGVLAPATNSSTTTTTGHNNAAAQGTYTPPDKNTPYRWSGTGAYYVQ
ncbi:hypothetical protein [Candidatus Binatus sp.]|uniref:hypothetical protein n=1 Tax=Candidatus Binatus sp. TaxID=2811406 RepID=UPI002F92BF4C